VNECDLILSDVCGYMQKTSH